LILRSARRRPLDNQPLNRTVLNATNLMEDFQFGELSGKFMIFSGANFAIVYRNRQNPLRDEKAVSPIPVLVQYWRLAEAPASYMPFITEELWQTLIRGCRRTIIGLVNHDFAYPQ